MSFIGLVLLIIIAGVAMALLPMDARLKNFLGTVVILIVAIVLILWLLSIVGISTGIRLP